MKAKQFFHVCAGIFLLVGAWTIGAQHASALSGNARHRIIAISGNHVLRSDGTPWFGGSDWVDVSAESNPYTPLPVATKEIEFWSLQLVVTKAGDGWWFSADGWKNIGPIPEPDAAQPSDWSGVKDGYRK